MQCVLSNTHFSPVSNLIPFPYPPTPAIRTTMLRPVTTFLIGKKKQYTHNYSLFQQTVTHFSKLQCEIKLETSSAIEKMLETLG